MLSLYIMTFYQTFGKRIFDLVFSLITLFLGWPVFLVLAQIIKISSPGPIIFKQKRVGKNNQIFTLYKFRTMVKNAEKLKKKYQHLNKANGPVFKIKHDPRFINGLGKFLARTGLDELPNVFNVLKGEMSWVGPRPFPVDEARKISPKIRKIRESALPGITSEWVIAGAHNLKFNQWMKLDQKYIKNITLTQDLKILAETTLVCLKAGRKILLKINH